VLPDRADLPDELAQYLLGVDFPEADQTRMEYLSRKANAGTLTAMREASWKIL
jgi:hypothetical protein